MKKMLLAVGSSISGNTSALAQAFGKGAAEAGYQVNYAYLADPEISDCRGCGACQINHSHRCAIQDKMQESLSTFCNYLCQQKNC